jgi:Flp pilus assembly protein CpaB
MSRRGRALAFLLAAALAAVGAATVVDGYGNSVVRGYGELRPVVVAAADLRAGETIGPALANSELEIRQVPTRFVPPGALVDPGDAVGLVAAVAIPTRAYVLTSQLRLPRPRSSPGAALGRGRRPVEIAVSGADALALVGADPVGSHVDVVITTEPSTNAAGRTYVGASAVPVLALGPGAEGPGPGASTAATLGLTRAQALRLIAAESFARRITVVPAP